MKPSNRLETAILKLYNAYNNDQLHPEDACRCAVGNILDQKDFWKHLSDSHGTSKLNYVGEIHERVGRKFNGYSPKELLEIEIAFLEGCGYSLPYSHTSSKPVDPTHPDILFYGLVHTVKKLCAMDGIENFMDLERLFQTIRTQKLHLSAV